MRRGVPAGPPLVVRRCGPPRPPASAGRDVPGQPNPRVSGKKTRARAEPWAAPGSSTPPPPRAFGPAPERGAERPARARPMPLALTAIVIVGAIARVWDLGATSLNFDESYSAMVGRLSLSHGFGFLRNHDSHPPLDYLFQLPLAR